MGRLAPEMLGFHHLIKKWIMVEWHEREIVRNIRIYDSAMTLQDFVE